MQLLAVDTSLQQTMDPEAESSKSAEPSSSGSNPPEDTSLHPNEMQSARFWSQAVSATSARAQVLCEKLRLILQPTKASRLAGDYRTGKRINMRRVIQYIASQYRKDKIWLRRSKASQRTYQVLLAVDDSRSMRSGSTVSFAVNSIAMIS